MSPDVLQKYPFFHLITNHFEAEAALSVLTCFGNKQERQILKPKAKQVRRDYFVGVDDECLTKKVNRVLAEYLCEHGDFSDQLMVFLGKSVKMAQAH